MIKNKSRTILVVNDVEATRDGIKQMLEQDGYSIMIARNEKDAVEKFHLEQIDLMLVTFEGETASVIVAAERIRARAETGENTPIIIFCVGELEEEAAVEGNIYFSCPDDFNQLRKFIERLLDRFQAAAQI